MIILSRGRATTITTTNILPNWVEVLVPESEREAYEKQIENPILCIPDEYKGLGQVRNWVLDNFSEETVIMIDDDIVKCYCITREKAYKVAGDDLTDVLFNTAIMAKDSGAKIFGYTQTDIRKYKGCEPFQLCTWVGCVVGVIGRKFKFRNDKFKVDIDMCLQNLLVERIIWCDNRYYFFQQRDNNAGGNATYRTESEFQKSVESLLNKWGDYLKQGKSNKSQISLRLNVKRKQDIKYE